MGHPSGFLQFDRKTGHYLPPEERVKTWKEFTETLPDEELSRQGARCMDCGIPFCHSTGCPVYNLIPEWNDLVYHGDWREALVRLEMTNNLPEITGRICPAPCEASCTLAINSNPVTIKQLELAIIERGFSEGWVEPHPPRTLTGKRVAVVGSGPAGMAAAQQLRRSGHEVTLFERSPKIGGLLRYGIPDFKLEKHILDRRIAQMSAEGVRFETGVAIGEDISARYLRGNFDVVLLTLGAGQPRDLEVPGRELSGVHFAMDYLTRSNMVQSGELGEEKLISAKDKVTLVIGGGDTGSDCVGTSTRMRAKRVLQYEILPKPPEWKEAWNPSWPAWPNILRTSSSQEEGCERDWSVTTKCLTGVDGKLTEGHFARVEWNKGSNGSFAMKEIPKSEFSLKLDLVILAMGFVHVRHEKLMEELGVAYDHRGNIQVDPNYATSAPGVFAAGDANTGASLVVRAIYHGRQAAAGIDRYLKG
ncbi:MAG TPA: glutamate synthase subunit beta [Spirochaetia bacterium]|nr:glutamate synthase subunit beta [Spirochaetia bacterium]